MSLEIKVFMLIFTTYIDTRYMTLSQINVDDGVCSSHQVLEYHPQPWNQWQEIGNIQVDRQYHAALSIGPQQLPCLSPGGSFNRYDDDSDPSDLDCGFSL